MRGVIAGELGEQPEVGPVLSRLGEREDIFPLDFVNTRRLAWKPRDANGKFALPPRREAVADVGDELTLAIVLAVAPFLITTAKLELDLPLNYRRQIDLVSGIGTGHLRLQDQRCGDRSALQPGDLVLGFPHSLIPMAISAPVTT